MLLLAALLASAAGGCGHRGNPLPPLRHTPPALQDFRLAQRGSQLEVSLLAPAASVDGIPYESLAVEILFGEGQRDLEKTGERRLVAVKPGERLLETLPLSAPGSVARASARAVFRKEKGPRTLTMALVAQHEVAAPGGLEASLTPGGVRLVWTGELPKPVDAAVAPPRVPGLGGPTGSARPPAARGTTPAAEQQGVAAGPAKPEAAVAAPASESGPAGASGTSAADGKGVSEQAAGQEGAGAKPGAGPAGKAKEEEQREPESGFFVYRRVGGAAYFEPLVPTPLEVPELEDPSAPQGERACYVVRAVASLHPLVESVASNEACLDVRDIQPPETPGGLAVLPREHGIELVWTPSNEEDVASYRVYREAPGEPRQRLAEVEAGKATWTDEKARPGVVYRYSLTAVDRSGNESAPTPAVEAALQ
jgi:hypothetical protein